jgi:hypothetical protein
LEEVLLRVHPASWRAVGFNMNKEEPGTVMLRRFGIVVLSISKEKGVLMWSLNST